MKNYFKMWLIPLLYAMILMAPVAAVSQLSTVNLGTAGDFVILSKTGISNTGVTAITGDMGVSPISATAITGFGLIMDPSGTFSTSSLVTGKICAADYTDPTPTKLTTAVSDMETAYTDAAGRTLPDYTELYAGDVTGQTLTPGLYKWGTGVLISAGGVTISGAASDVWIFQIAQDLIVANGANITLSGGAQASNIFWQVSGQVTLGTGAAMKGIILSQTLVEMQTGATLDGRTLAQTAVTLDANSVTISGTVTSVDNDEKAFQEFELSQNYPNPFNPWSNIKYNLKKSGNVTLTIFNLAGQEIETLVNGFQSAGEYQIKWKATGFPSGIYFYRFQVGDFSETKKLILQK